MSKIVYDSSKKCQFVCDGELKASYIPEINVDDITLLDHLSKIDFTRVHYISRFNKANRTPRFTWCYGKVDDQNIVSYKGLNFMPEVMPDWLEELSNYCRQTSLSNYKFDPEYNSCIIGRYDSSDDQIGFHFDTETFLTHHFCANVTLGYARDFQFKDANKQLYEIKLQNKSLLFFSGLEHSLPKRAAVKEGDIRYSISFRNMKNNIGIGNIYYYCRGFVGAINDNNKSQYENDLKILQSI